MIAVSDVLAVRRLPGAKVLAALGVERVARAASAAAIAARPIATLVTPLAMTVLPAQSPR